MDSAKPSLREIFADAAEIAEPAERVAFLDAACQGNRALRERVEQLLNADESAGGFLQSPGDTTRAEIISEKPGDRIGRYRLIERIGRGGGGVVYLAEQEEPVRRRVALKILRLGMDTQSVVARFEAERQALAMMDHPNIARVLDAGATDKGRPFFVMELVSGKRLSDYCEVHQLSLRQRLELFIPVCQAVQHAHQKGIIHRDLKPSNILVTEHEGVAVPKVIDFGIAKATEEGVGEGGLTSVNQFLGTPAYMSPEQVEFGRRDIDTRSDIYSLGVVLYELLAGEPPFELAGAGLEEMRRLIREVDPPRPSTRITRNLSREGRSASWQLSREQLAAVRGDLDWIVMKCLEKDRRRRYETANGLATDIQRHLRNEPVVARPPTQFYRLQKIVRRHRLGFSAASVVILVLIAAVFVSTQLALRARRAEREQTRFRSLAEVRAHESHQLLIRRYVAEGNRQMEEGRPLTALPWMVEALQLEAGDPQREPDERLRIAQTLVGAPELRLHLSQSKSVNSVALSPDGSLVATGGDDGSVWVSDVERGVTSITNLSLFGTVGRVSFSPDGRMLVAVSMGGQARVWKPATGEPLTPLLQAQDFDASSLADVLRVMKPTASFSPDGKLLLLAWGSKSAQLRDAASGNLMRELSHGDVVYHAAFSSDGRLVVTSSADGTARIWEVATGKSVGPTLRHGGAVYWAQFSSDGKTLLTVRDGHYVQLWDWREGRRIAQEIPRKSRLYHASLSPDGSNILTTAWSGYAHLYDAATGRMMSQFQQQGGVVAGAFSPDGTHIAIACEDGNAWLWELYDALGRPMPLPQGNHIDEIAFSGDGRRLAVAGRGGYARVWDLFPAERGVRRLPGNDVEWVEFEPSGRRALLVSTGNRSSLSVYEVQTGKCLSIVNFSPDQVTRARFSPDGNRILAFGNTSAVSVFDADSGRELFPPLQHEHRVKDALWSPDGKVILTAAGASGARAWDVGRGKVAVSFPHTKAVTAIAISPDGLRFATGQEDNTVQIWEELTTRRCAGVLTASGRIGEIRFSPDGRLLAISTMHGPEGVVELRELGTGAVVGQPLIHRDAVESFEFSRDGRFLATTCLDHNARVWNAATGDPVSPWLSQDFEGRDVRFSPNGDRFVTLARRGAVRLWNARTGEPITAPLNYPRNNGTGGVSYSPDGLRLLVARGGNEAWVRELQPETATVEQLRLLAQVLSCTRYDPAAGMVPMDEEGLDHAWKELRAMLTEH
jgi:WD40 repeat protein/serine/threonine protein kinase